MQTNQDRVLAHFEQLITKAGFVPVIRQAFANGGVVGVQNTDLPINLMEVSYGFQAHNMSFTISVTDGEKMVEIPSQQNRPDYFDFLMNYTSVREYEAFILRFTALLDQTKVKFGKKKTRKAA